MPIPTPPRRLSPDVFTCVDVAKDTQRCMGVRIDFGDSARLVAPMTDALADRYERARRALTDEGDS